VPRSATTNGRKDNEEMAVKKHHEQVIKKQRHVLLTASFEYS
jgi:hypothetical protein